MKDRVIASATLFLVSPVVVTTYRCPFLPASFLYILNLRISLLIIVVSTDRKRTGSGSDNVKHKREGSFF